MCKCNQEEIAKKYDGYKAQILEANTSGPYWHNVISLILCTCAKELGKEYANKLIDEMELDFEKAA